MPLYNSKLNTLELRFVQLASVTKQNIDIRKIKLIQINFFTIMTHQFLQLFLHETERYQLPAEYQP